MFGVLAGMALFSVSIRGHLQSELERAEEAKLERTRQETQALARAVEAAVMTETSSTYSADITLNRILQNVDGATGLTAGGSAAQINTFQTGPMGRVMIGLTDDEYVRNELATAAGDLTQSPLGARADVAMVDMAALRTRQVELSLKNLDQEAGLLYYFWNRQNRFPTDQAEYKAQVNAVSGLRDFWGQDFTYTAVDANNGDLAFTTPWGETRSVSVTLVTTGVSTTTSSPPTAICNSVGQVAHGGRCLTTGSDYLIGWPQTTFEGALIVAESDAPTNLGWGSQGVLRGTFSRIDGIANTLTLASFGDTAHPPAAFCANLVLGGYSDWYLPALDELRLAYIHRQEIGGFVTTGTPTRYWSSTEWNGGADPQNRADGVDFLNGNQPWLHRSGQNRVRCFRRAH